MTDKTDCKEREADSLIRKLRDVLDEARSYIGAPTFSPSMDRDAAIAVEEAELYLAGRASLAANAGREPVAWRIDWPDEPELGHYFSESPTDSGRCQPLYTHPSPPEGMVGGWIALPGALPEPGTPVLLDIGKKYPIRAMWAAKFTLPVSLEDDSGFGEHDERTDEWYCPEGWYEWNEHEETHWAVSATPRAWAPLPPTSSADSRKGE